MEPGIKDERATTLRGRRKEELHEHILAAARALFVQVGYDAFSMRKLAQEVGCSAGNLYLYFRSREDLFRHLIDASFAELHASLRARIDAGPADPVARLKRGLRAYVDFGLRHPDAYRMAFVVNRPPARGKIEPHAAFQFLRATVQSCMAARRFRAVDAELASQALWTAIHGLTSLLVQLPQFPWVGREALITTVVDNAVDPFVRPGTSRSARKGRS